MTIRSFQTDDALDVLQLRMAAFSQTMGVPSETTTTEIYIPDQHRLVSVDDSGRLIGHFGAWPFAQSFGGRLVPMAGVGGVAVAVDQRRQGVGSQLLEAGLAMMAEQGSAISTLYPTTPAPYRSWGWEMAGEHVRRRVTTRDLLDLEAPDSDITLRPFDLADLDAVVAVHDGVTATEPGGLVGGRLWLSRFLTPDPDEPEISIVAERNGAVVGNLLAAKTAPADDHSAYGLRVLHLIGIDRSAEIALWHNIASHYPVAATTTFNSQPADPLLFELPYGLSPTPASSQNWMTRIVDAPAAVAARGWPPVRGTVALTIRDRRVAANDGAFVLEADGSGAASLTPGGDGHVSIDINSLAPLYSGFVSPAALARGGRLSGAGRVELDFLAVLFAGGAPFMRDYF